MPSASQPIFEKINIQKQIDEAFSRQVWLKCGGYIVIDETEALISVDVNTGRNRGSKDVDKMILQTNIEAAEEVARQLRLRNIGGLVVVDFIDMRHRKDQMAVYKAMKERVKRDKAKTQILQISAIGLMEMTRQRLNESLRDSMYEPCPYCQGRGRVKTPMTMSIEIQRRLNTIIQTHRDQVGDLVVIVNSDVLNRFKKEDAKVLVELERSHAGRLIFRSDPTLNRERFAIVDAATDKTIDQG
jgi:ribonuclease G